MKTQAIAAAAPFANIIVDPLCQYIREAAEIERCQIVCDAALQRAEIEHEKERERISLVGELERNSAHAKSAILASDLPDTEKVELYRREIELQLRRSPQAEPKRQWAEEAVYTDVSDD